MPAICVSRQQLGFECSIFNDEQRLIGPALPLFLFSLQSYFLFTAVGSRAPRGGICAGTLEHHLFDQVHTQSWTSLPTRANMSGNKRRRKPTPLDVVVDVCFDVLMRIIKDTIVSKMEQNKCQKKKVIRIHNYVRLCSCFFAFCDWKSAELWPRCSCFEPLWIKLIIYFSLFGFKGIRVSD